MDTNTITAFSGFLEWGAVGLAGLMMVLTILALMSGKLTPERAGLLRTFLYVGAFCFMAALAAQVFTRQSDHNLVVQVLPNDLVGSSFPEPRIQANGEIMDRADGIVISSATNLSIDMSEALGLFKRKSEDVEQAIAQVETTKQALSEATQQAQTAETVVQQKQSEVARLERETAAKERKLAQTNEALKARESELAQKDQRIAEVVAASETLVREIQTIDLPAPAPVITGPTENVVNQIERDIRKLTQELKTTISP